MSLPLSRARDSISMGVAAADETTIAVVGAGTASIVISSAIGVILLVWVGRAHLSSPYFRLSRSYIWRSRAISASVRFASASHRSRSRLAISSGRSARDHDTPQ